MFNWHSLSDFLVAATLYDAVIYLLTVCLLYAYCDRIM